MTVGELIEELKKFDKNLNVSVQFRDSGGVWFRNTSMGIYRR